jgi:hypothetical protein
MSLRLRTLGSLRRSRESGAHDGPHNSDCMWRAWLRAGWMQLRLPAILGPKHMASGGTRDTRWEGIGNTKDIRLCILSINCGVQYCLVHRRTRSFARSRCGKKKDLWHTEAQILAGTRPCCWHPHLSCRLPRAEATREENETNWRRI